MEDINNLIATSIDKYYEILSTLGYKSYDDVYKLLVLIAIQQLLDNYTEFITEDDIKTFYRVISCISGNCIIDELELTNEDSFVHEIKTLLNLRITQCGMFRTSTDNILRIKI